MNTPDKKFDKTGRVKPGLSLLRSGAVEVLAAQGTITQY